MILNERMKRQSRNRWLRPKGVVLLEMLIAAALVLTTLSVAAPLVIRSARAWKQTRQYQVACDELSAHMDRLLAMPAEKRKQALPETAVASEVAEILHAAEISGEILDDQNGTRLRLSIQWERTGQAPPVTLVGWIDPLPQGQEDDGSGEEETSETEEAN